MSYSPLNLSEIERIDSINLSNIDRHHLRLLAHCLASFKEIADDASTGHLPSEQDCLQWLVSQPALAKDKAFIRVLLEQFVVAAIQLDKIADECGISPLELTVNELIDASLRDREL